MNRVFWVVPGESLDLLKREFSYKLVDRSLTDRGIVQARQTAKQLTTQDISVLYSSPLKRAIETADIFKIRMALPIIPVESFRAINVGELEKHPHDRDSLETYRRIRKAWREGEKSIRFPAGEDLYMLLARMQEGLTHIACRNTGANIIVVGHSDLLQATIQYLCPAVEYHRLAEEPMPNCCITELSLEVSGGKLAVKLGKWAACDHLSGDAANRKQAFFD